MIMIKLTALDGTSLNIFESEEDVDAAPLMGSNGMVDYMGPFAGVKGWAIANSLFIENLVDGVYVADVDSAEAMLSIHKASAIQKVRTFAENMRSRFTEGAAKGKLGGYQINSDILNLLDSGVAFNDLDSLLQQKVEVEVTVDNRYTSVDGLIAVWRAKRGALAIVSAWVGAFENNTITAVNAATAKPEIDSILASVRVEAEAKAAELASL